MSQCGASDVTGLCHGFGMWCVRCHKFMPQVWHVVRQMYTWFGIRCHGVCASDVMSRNVKTAAADICSLEVVELRL